MSHKQAKQLRKELGHKRSGDKRKTETIYHSVIARDKDGKLRPTSRGQVLLMDKRGEYQMIKRGTEPC